MLVKICLALGLLACVPAWCQTQTNDAEANKPSEDDSQLQVPPPVSGQAYATTFEGENESNYLRGGVTFTGAYSSNVSYGATPVGDMSYSIWPTIALDKTTYRMHLVLDYAPGFTLYQRMSSLNQADQSLAVNLQYRLSPNLTATLAEGFQKTTNFFNQPNPLSATPVTGSVPVSNIAVIPPLAEMISNTTTSQLSYQMSADSMIGGGGSYTTLTYPNPDQVEGVFNSRSAGGSFFYSTRFREKNYIGASYQYGNYLSFQSNSPSTGTQTQTIFLFFTMFLKPNLSLSVSGGPQHYSSTQASSPSVAAWQPMTVVSMGWQGQRTTLAASYARTVSGGGGLNGTFHTNAASTSFSWQINRDWTAALSGSYSNYKNLTPFFLFSTPGGHMLSGSASLQRQINPHTNFQLGYSWAQQSYLRTSGSSYPDLNRVFVTVSFTFAKPLQR